MLHSGADTCVEDSTVERKRIAVFVVSGGRLGGVESDIFPKRFDAVVAVLARVLYAALIGAHLYLVAKLGTTAPPWQKAEESEELREAEA